MRKSFALAAGVALAAAGLAVAGPQAQAADCAPGPTSPNVACTTQVTAVVGGTGLSGLRTLGSVTPVTLAGTSSLTGALAVPVVETAAAGVNPWYVTASSSNLSSGGNSINASNLTVADTSLPSGVGCLSTSLLVGLRCTVTGGGGARALDSTKTLFTVANEDTATAYTGTYDYSGLLSLAVPNGTQAGTYTGTLTLTLVQ